MVANVLRFVAPVFENLPLERAMPDLVPQVRSPRFGGAESYENAFERAYGAVAHAVEQLDNHPALVAGLWLYVDDLERSHQVSQGIHSSVGSFWHGIMHRREGDFSNSKYWFRQAGAAPFELEGYDPQQFVDEVEAAGGANPAELVEKQRWEWKALFDYCIGEGL